MSDDVLEYGYFLLFDINDIERVMQQNNMCSFVKTNSKAAKKPIVYILGLVESIYAR